MKQIHELQETIHYHFKTPLYLEIALTHSSYANEVKHQVKYNERQEFLGDAVLSIIVSDYLFNNYTVPEGELTKLRAAIVCEKSLDVMANKIGLGQYLRLGRGEEMTGGRTRPSIIADAFEALIAAIYLDSGIESARSFVLPFVIEMLEHEDSLSFKDYKTILQEIIQQNPEEKLVYKLVEEKGPDHDKRFVVDVLLNSNVIGKGEGRSKKNAEQMAAKEALELMGQ
ncbi:ribonuclease III [uncultured Negativibacillus sp.]|uniref:ribonuclease III n=1 Tax=uncultured Negativibacillus sp. TaxID=1980696 RepID=UPI0025E2F3F6|nr:ribonuclease III [uncultured Negativibacillus sp.]